MEKQQIIEALDFWINLYQQDVDQLKDKNPETFKAIISFNEGKLNAALHIKNVITGLYDV